MNSASCCCLTTERSATVNRASGSTRMETGTCCSSTVAVTIAVPTADDVNVVCATPSAVTVEPGETKPGPEVTKNVTGMPSGTWPYTGSCQVPAESTVRFASIRELFDFPIAGGVAVTVRTRFGEYVTLSVTRDDTMLFAPHQLYRASIVPLISSPSCVRGNHTMPSLLTRRENRIV